MKLHRSNLVFALVLLPLLACRPEEIEELENYGVDRSWIPFSHYLNPQAPKDTNFIGGSVIDAFPWNRYSLFDGKWIVENVAPGRSGNRSLKLSNLTDETSTVTIWRQDPTEDLQGTRVRLTGYVRARDFKGHVELGYTVHTKFTGEKHGGDTVKSEELRNGWNKLTVEFDVPDLDAWLVYGIEAAGSGEVWIDDIAIESISKPATDRPYKVEFTRANLGFENYKVNDGNQWWQKSGPLDKRLSPWYNYSLPQDYAVTIDSTIASEGKYCLKVHSSKADLYGRAIIGFPLISDLLAGQRVKFTMDIEGENISGLVTLEANCGSADTFHNEANKLWQLREAKGWQPYSIVIDVPEDMTWAQTSLTLLGTGTVWIDNLRYERVSPLATSASFKDKSMYFAKPLNMGFEGD